MAKKPKIQTRKPPTAAQQEQFVAGGMNAVKSRSGKTTTYTRKTGEAAGEALRRVTLYFPTELHKRARIAAVEADLPLSDLVVEVLSKALGKR